MLYVVYKNWDSFPISERSLKLVSNCFTKTWQKTLTYFSVYNFRIFFAFNNCGKMSEVKVSRWVEPPTASSYDVDIIIMSLSGANIKYLCLGREYY